MEKVHRYSDVITEIRLELNKLENLSEFSKKHNISYLILSSIKNNKMIKGYPLVIIKLYKILFDKDLFLEKHFVEK